MKQTLKTALLMTIVTTVLFGAVLSAGGYRIGATALRFQGEWQLDL